MKLEHILTFLFLGIALYDLVKVQVKVIEDQKKTNIDIDSDKQKESEIEIENNIDIEEDISDSGFPINVEIQYCNKTGLHTQYLELEKNIYLTFPSNKNIQIISSPYPLPHSQEQIATALNYGQYALMALMIFSKQLFGFIGMSVPHIIEKLVEKKMFVLGGIIILNSYFQNQLLSTGKMRVFVDSNMVYDNAVPNINVETILMQVKNEGVLVMNYTDNHEEVTVDKLQQYLQEQGQYDEEVFQQNVDLFKQLIEELIQDDTEQTYEEFGIKGNELHQVWLQEKDRVLSQYIKRKTQGYKIEKFQWSVNNQFYGKRHKNINKACCIMNLKSKDVRTKNYKFHTFEMQEEDLNYMESEFKKIEQTVNALLL